MHRKIPGQQTNKQLSHLEKCVNEMLYFCLEGKSEKAT